MMRGPFFFFFLLSAFNFIISFKHSVHWLDIYIVCHTDYPHSHGAKTSRSWVVAPALDGALNFKGTTNPTISYRPKLDLL